MKRILFFLMAATYSVVLQAAKAHPQPFTVTQSDGTQLTVTFHGDEDFHYYTTTDGVILFRDGNGYYVANIDNNGNISATGQLAHNLSVRSAQEKTLAESQSKGLFFAAASRKSDVAKSARLKSAKAAPSLFPHEGTPKVLVVLAEFSDVKFQIENPEKAFNQYLNAQTGEIENLGNGNRRNYGSVAQYFDDMSFGKFRPQFDVYGPITLDKPLAYYGEGKDDRMDLLLPDVCKKVDADVDFTQYAHDGYVDLIYVIYAGYSASWGGNTEECIWPKSGTKPGVGQYDGVTVYRYGVSNELNYTPTYEYNGEKANIINGIGLFCHEFSHCMGMPDLYVTVNDATIAHANNQEMEYWSIMDAGTYLANGYRPSAYTAWEREFFDWYNIETLDKPAFVELKPIDEEGGKAYRIKNDNDAIGNEYYVVENIQNTNWNGSQFGHGMLAIHVDYDANAFSLSSNSVNNRQGQPRMTVLAADGTLLNEANATSGSQFKEEAAGDPFPGKAEVTELTDDTDVKPIIYTGDKLGKPIYDIQESEDGVITFKYLDPTITGIKDAIVETEQKTNKIYTLDGRFVGTTTDGLNKGIYIIGNKKVVIK